MNLELISALVLGFVGSLHCAGMCGPIALALPLSNRSWIARISGGLLYNLGRTVTYGIMGAMFGLAGLGLAMGGLQQWVSIILGIIMILVVIIPRLGAFGRKAVTLSDSWTGYLKRPFIRLFKQRSYGSLFFIGILNGFLPCGLVYIALAGAIMMSHAYQGAIYMVLFGLGTIPMLIALSVAGNLLSQKIRKKLTVVIPAFIIILGILFILRGMNLGIPYISPKLEKEGGKSTMECCHPKK